MFLTSNYYRFQMSRATVPLFIPKSCTIGVTGAHWNNVEKKKKKSSKICLKIFNIYDHKIVASGEKSSFLFLFTPPLSAADLKRQFVVSLFLKSAQR